MLQYNTLQSNEVPTSGWAKTVRALVILKMIKYNECQ